MNGLAARRGLSIALLVSILSGLVPLTLAPAPAFAANPSVDLKAVTFLDSSTGFAAGANGVIAKTTDGGDNWTVVRSGSEDFRGIVFWNSLQGLAVTYDRKAFGTNDGGATWQLLTAEMTAQPYLEYIGIDRIAAPPGPTDRLAFAAGGYSPMSGLSYVPEQVYRTYGNGGAYWGIPGGSLAPVLRPCRYPDPSGETGGDNVGRGEFFGIDFVDASRGWAVGVDYFPSTPTATVYATADGGNTWSQQSVGAPVALRDVSFATTATGVAVSAQGRVFYTRNGGATWQGGVSGTTAALYAVEMIDSSTAWAVGAGGQILKTTDGGATWAAVTSPTTNDLVDITSFGTKAWAVGRYGTVVLTTDGITWRRAQPGPTVETIAGDDRIATAIEASKKAFPDGAPAVVIATAYNWPDALGGSALAGAAGGPILLTQKDALPSAVLAEVERLGATKAYVLGGAGAVGAPVESALKQKLGAANVVRIAGADRYATARLVSAECVRLLGASYDGHAFVATGKNFPDALGASPVAAAKGWPVYLVDPARGADAALTGAMKAAGVTKAVVLGGTAVVPDSVKNAIASAVGCATDRWWGADRYATAAAVAAKAVSEAGLSYGRTGIANGENFPDALAGGVAQGKAGSVLLLTKPSTLPEPTRKALADNKARISEVRFYGGTGAVSQAVRDAALGVLVH